MTENTLQVNVSSNDKLQLQKLIQIIKKKYKSSYDYESFLKCVIESFKAYENIQSISPYKKSKQTQPCSICNKQISFNQHIRQNACNHIYHKRCIDSLIINYNFVSCPICFKQFKPQN